MGYQCEICGKTYPSIRERAACEARCLQKQQADSEKLMAERKQKDMEDARKEIDASIDTTERLLKQYKERFGEEAPVVHQYKKEIDFESVWPSVFHRLFW